MTNVLKPPFPWFGGKSRVAAQVWPRLGDVDDYVEPFFGSGAVLFNRQTAPRIETVNDLDHWIANFWRAVQHDPEGVAEHADNPVNEDDLMARHLHLVGHVMPELAVRIMADPDYYDAKAAGWWVWGICCWIGGGWCSGRGPWTEKDGQLVHLGDAGQGVNRQLVHLGSAGRGVNRQRVHLGDAGQGVNRRLVHLGPARGVNRPRGETCQDRREALITYMHSLADRLRGVRVCCGDWARVVTNGALTNGASVGVFLDPPYSQDIRDAGCYNTDGKGDDLPTAVRAWCVEHGDNRRYRIALCGYEGEHNALEALGWSKLAWKAGGAYQTANSASAGSNMNRHLERIWFSPACLKGELW